MSVRSYFLSRKAFMCNLLTWSNFRFRNYKFHPREKFLYKDRIQQGLAVMHIGTYYLPYTKVLYTRAVERRVKYSDKIRIRVVSKLPENGKVRISAVQWAIPREIYIVKEIIFWHPFVGRTFHVVFSREGKTADNIFIEI